MAAGDLTLPKMPVAVELALEGREPRRVEVYVALHSEHAFRRQHVIDLLEDDAQFVPARAPGDGAVTLVNKATTRWLGVPLTDGTLPVEETPQTADSELYDERHFVRVELLGGDALEGDILYSAPAARARITDYLNRGGRFFRLWTPDYLYLINKAYVLGVVEPTEA